jgi:hypothetical protein
VEPTAPSALVVSRLFGLAGRLVQCGGYANPARRLTLTISQPNVRGKCAQNEKDGKASSGRVSGNHDTVRL